MRLINYIIVGSIIFNCTISCTHKPKEQKLPEARGWKSEFKSRLSGYGHRNWILIVDKAFPKQNSPGLVTIDTHQSLKEVLDYALIHVGNSLHVKPQIFFDKELSYINKAQIENIDDHKLAMLKLVGKYKPQEILHDSVFVKINEAAKLFEVLVLKTDEVIPYSSVFIQLDCKYWNAEKEYDLRKKMSSQAKL